MRLLVDFSHRIVVEDLDNGTKAQYFVPRGTNTPLHIPPQQEELLHRALEREEKLGVLAVEEREACPDEETVSSSRSESALPLLSPGVLSGGVDPADIFGASQG